MLPWIIEVVLSMDEQNVPVAVDRKRESSELSPSCLCADYEHDGVIVATFLDEVHEHLERWAPKSFDVNDAFCW